jgi:hypothetical protein
MTATTITELIARANEERAAFERLANGTDSREQERAQYRLGTFHGLAQALAALGVPGCSPWTHYHEEVPA